MPILSRFSDIGTYTINIIGKVSEIRLSDVEKSAVENK